MKIECGKTYKTKHHGYIVTIDKEVIGPKGEKAFSGSFANGYLNGRWYEYGDCIQTDLDPSIRSLEINHFDLIAEIP